MIEEPPGWTAYSWCERREEAPGRSTDVTAHQTSTFLSRGISSCTLAVAGSTTWPFYPQFCATSVFFGFFFPTSLWGVLFLVVVPRPPSPPPVASVAHSALHAHTCLTHSGCARMAPQGGEVGGCCWRAPTPSRHGVFY